MIVSNYKDLTKSPKTRLSQKTLEISSEGYFSGKYFVKFSKTVNKPEKICFVFSGQGSFYPGLFKEAYIENKEVRDNFKIVDAFARVRGLPAPSSYIILHEKLTASELESVQNLCLFTLQVSFCSLLKKQNIVPKIVTGHSFGEFAALVVAGIVKFEDMVEFIYYRESWCPSKNERGYMIAINSDVSTVKKILGKKKYYISNINSPTQTVVSVKSGEEINVKKIFETRKIRAKILKVPQPYHTPFLNDVTRKFLILFRRKSYRFCKPKIDFLSSVLGKFITRDNFDSKSIKRIIAYQISKPFDFANQSRKVFRSGISNFIEIGPGDVFVSLIEDSLKGQGIVTNSVDKILFALKNISLENTRTSIEEQKPSRLIRFVNKILSKTTGYAVEKISLEDRLVEDLGLDSIKRTEVLFTVMDESKIKPQEDFNISKFKRIKDIVNFVEDELSGNDDKSSSRIKQKVIEFNRYKPEFIRKNAWIIPQYNFKPPVMKIVKLSDIFKGNVFSLPSMSMIIDDLDKGNILAEDGVFEVNKIVRFVNLFRKSENKVVFLVSFRSVKPVTGGLISFLKSLKKETPSFFFKHLHYNKSLRKAKIVKDIAQEIRESKDIEIYFKNNKRCVKILKKMPISHSKFKKLRNVVAIGGAKGITLSIIKDLVKRDKPSIYVVGRSNKNQNISALKILKNSGAKVHYIKCDCANSEEANSKLGKVLKNHEIDLVINGAGLEYSKLFKNKSDKEIKNELIGNIMPSLNVARVCKKFPPKKLVQFSSLTSEIGNPGQTIYSCAKEINNRIILDYLESNKQNNALSMGWPAWDNVGMTSKDSILKDLKLKNLPLLKPSLAYKLFQGDLLNSNLVHYASQFYIHVSGLSLQNQNSYSPLLGKLASRLPVKFEKIISTKQDDYINHHKVNNLRYLPASVIISMHLALARCVSDKFEIEDFIIHNPLIIKKNMNINYEANFTKGGTYLLMRSNVPISSSKILKKSKTKKFIKRKEKFPSKHVKIIYPENKKIYLGPKFRCLKKVGILKNNSLIASIDNSKLVQIPELGEYGFLSQWIESSLQLLSLVRSLGESIPTKIRRISVFNSEPSQIIYCMTKNTKVNKEGISGDVEVSNDKGELILRLIGVDLKFI